MKKRITRKAVIEYYGLNNIIQIGYCNIQTLLRPFSPKLYTAGGDGWDADIYHVGSYAICTGYRPFGGIVPDYKTCEKYESLARAIDEGGHTWEQRKQLKRELITEFITEVTK